MRRDWLVVIVAAAGVGVFAAVSNVTTVAQMSGQSDVIAAARKTLSQLLNAGTVWGGLSVFAGWRVRRPIPAIAAGIIAPLVALLTHYGLGDLLWLMPWASWVENRYWFVAALILGAPLGIVGSIARRNDVSALIARLVVPLGAVTEPLAIGWIPPAEFEIWSNRVAAITAGILLMISGAVAALVVIRRWRKPPEGATGGRPGDQRRSSAAAS